MAVFCFGARLWPAVGRRGVVSLWLDLLLVEKELTTTARRHEATRSVLVAQVWQNLDVGGRDGIGEVGVEAAEVFVGGAASGHERPCFEALGRPTTRRIPPIKVSQKSIRRQV